MASHGRRFARASVKRHKAMKAKQKAKQVKIRKQVKNIQKMQKSTKQKFESLQHSVYKNSPAARSLKQNTAFMSKKELMKNGYNREKAFNELNKYNNRVSSTRSGVKDIWDRSANTIIHTRKGREYLAKKSMTDDEFIHQFHNIQVDKKKAQSFWSLYSKLEDVMKIKGVTATSPQIAKEAILHFGNGETEIVSDSMVDELMGMVYGIQL